VLDYVYESGHEDRRRVGEILHACLAQLGIELRITELPWPDLWERVCVPDSERVPAIVANGWWPDYADVIDYLYPMYHSSQWPPEGIQLRQVVCVQVQDLARGWATLRYDMADQSPQRLAFE